MPCRTRHHQHESPALQKWKSLATVITVAELRQRYGLQAKAKHCRALDRLSALVNAGTLGCACSNAPPGSTTLGAHLRPVHADVLEAQFKKHIQHVHKPAEGQWTPDQQFTDIHLVQSAFTRALHAMPQEPRAPKLDITIASRRKGSRKRSVDMAFAIRVQVDTNATMPDQS